MLLMGKTRNCSLLIAGVVLALSAIPAAHAQVQRSGGGANAQLAQQYQQAVAEKTQLQADNEKLKKELDDTKKALAALKQQSGASKSAAGAAAAQLAAAQASAQTANQSLEQTKGRMQELVGKFRETAVTLRGVEGERAQLQQQLNQSKAQFDQCAQRNAQLRDIDNEVLDRYEHEGAFSRVARAEPFTRLKRTQVENFADETKERAEELRVEKAAGQSPNKVAPDTPVQFTAPPPPEASEPASAASSKAGSAPPH